MLSDAVRLAVHAFATLAPPAERKNATDPAESAAPLPWPGHCSGLRHTMKTSIAVALFTSLSAIPFVARGADVASSPPPAPMPALPTPSFPAPSFAAPSASCHLGDHGGVEDADAQTAAQLVCVEIARAGAPAGSTYRVDVGRLGSLVILTVAREAASPTGNTDAREIKLHGIEEVATAAPRIAAAIVNGTALDESIAPGPLAVAERRNVLSASKIHFALGLIGQFPPLDRAIAPAPGINLELHSEIDPFEIVGSLRFGADSSDRTVGVVFVNFAMGGRYFPIDGDTSPYLGGGVAWTQLAVDDNLNHDFSGNHTGLGAYGEAGVEFMRTRHTHLAFGARLDAPFFSLINDRASGQYFGTQSSQPTSTPAPLPASIYYAPLSLELRLTF